MSLHAVDHADAPPLTAPTEEVDDACLCALYVEDDLRSADLATPLSTGDRIICSLYEPWGAPRFTGIILAPLTDNRYSVQLDPTESIEVRSPEWSASQCDACNAEPQKFLDELQRTLEAAARRPWDLTAPFTVPRNAVELYRR